MAGRNIRLLCQRELVSCMYMYSVYSYFRSFLMNNCSENNSASSTTQYCSSNFNQTSESRVLYIISSILCFVESILMVLLGSQIMYSVYINKTLRDPVSVVMASATVFLMLFTIPIVLFGLSLLTDLPLLGDCSDVSFITIPAFMYVTDNYSIGLMATVQFLTIKYGRKKVTNCKVLPVFAALVILSVLIAIVGNVLQNIMQGNNPREKIRGSLCVINANAGPIYAIASVLGYLIPFTVTMVMSYMSHRTVRNSVIEMDSDHSVIRSVIIMSVTTILVAFVMQIPVTVSFFWAINSHNIVAYQMMSLLAPPEPLCFLFLFATIHKTIRHELLENICKYIKCGALPEPNDDTV